LLSTRSMISRAATTSPPSAFSTNAFTSLCILGACVTGSISFSSAISSWVMNLS
jgi:hypothetical protein